MDVPNIAVTFTEQMERIKYVTGKRTQIYISFSLAEFRYETGDAATERLANEEALRRIPTRMLADELVRRVAVSQKTGAF
ncbi:MAG: hypothetical protein DELT_01324 [Desulfovibrio sp.]